jgi:hypothetical protein
MTVETIGDAWRHGWRLRVRCGRGRHDTMKTTRECMGTPELDLETLVWTRGADFPFARLESRMKCPRCGSRRVVLLFDIPSQPSTQRIRA